MSGIRNVFLQLRHMKHIVQVYQMWWQCDLICYLSDSLVDLIWPYELQRQLFGFDRPPNARGRGNSEEHMIPSSNSSGLLLLSTYDFCLLASHASDLESV